MAAQGIDILTLTFKATTAVAKRRLVGFDGAQIATAGAAVLGVSPRPVTSGTHSDAVVIGTAPVELGGTVTAGARLASDAQGRAVTLASVIGSNPDAQSFGRALEAGFAGEVKEALLGR